MVMVSKLANCATGRTWRLGLIGERACASQVRSSNATMPTSIGPDAHTALRGSGAASGAARGCFSGDSASQSGSLAILRLAAVSCWRLQRSGTADDFPVASAYAFRDADSYGGGALSIRNCEPCSQRRIASRFRGKRGALSVFRVYGALTSCSPGK
jgi:hypothetical protein